MLKSTPEEIRARFDNDVERFSDLETGQTATIDASLMLELVSRAAPLTTPGAQRLLDVGCGAGNYALKLLEQFPGLAVDLVDLSRPMLDRARERLSSAGSGPLRTICSDIRTVSLEPGSYDLITAGATLHHLRHPAEWTSVFGKLFAALRVGGSLWIVDLVAHELESVQQVMWQAYGEYLTSMQDEAYRDHVFQYIEREDSPRPLLWQLDLLRASGFSQVELIHKNGPFAAFCAVK